MRTLSFICLMLLVTTKTLATQTLLIDAYQNAIKYGIEFAIAKSKHDIVREEVQQAKSLIYPKISLLANYDYEDGDQSFGSSLGEPSRSSNLQLTLKQPIYNRAYWYRIEAAKENELSSASAFKSYKQEVAYVVSEAYFLQVFNRNSLDVLMVEKKGHKIQLEKIQKQYEKGLSDKISLLNAELELNKSNSKILKARGELKKSSLDFKRLVGKDLIPMSSDIPVSKYPSIINTLFKFERPLQDKEFWTNKALNNAEVVLFASKIEVEKHNKEVQKSDHYPSLSLDIESSRDKQHNIIQNVSNDVKVSLIFSMPLYQGGSTSSKVRAAQLQIQQAEQEYKSNLEMVKLEISAVIDNLTHNQSYMGSLRAGVQSAEELLDATNKMHKSGLQSLVDVRIAEAKLSLTRNSFLEALYVTLLHRMELFKLTGDLGVRNLTAADKLLNGTELN